MARRGLFMGFTLPYGGATPTLLTMAGPSHAATKWIRCGFPEIQNMLSSPSNPSDAGTFDTSELEDEVARVHAAGMGFLFSGLGVPKEVHPDAGTGGNWKYIPTDSAGRAQIGGYAAACATVLMDSHRATGMPVAIEWYQEPNIRAFNPAAQSSALVGLALAKVIADVRAAEPDLLIVAGSLANRGDYINPVPSDVGWTGPAFLQGMLTGAPALKTTARPDLWGYHPYCGSTSPLANKPWAMPQMDGFAFTLLANGVTKPDGSPFRVTVTEYGAAMKTAGFSQATQLQALKDYFTAFDARRDGTVSTYLEGTPEFYYTIFTGTSDTVTDPNSGAFNDEKSLYRAGGTHLPFLAGVEFERVSKLAASPPTAAFDRLPVAGPAPLTVQFTDRSNGAPLTWSWDFGDGTTSTLQTPTHTYTAAGTYVVKLTVGNFDGSDSTTRTVVVSNVSAPTAAFGFAPQGGTAPLAVTFTDQSTGATSWAWDFGDGDTSTSQNPSHTYDDPGVYVVELTATNASGSTTITHTITVLGAGVPVPEFTFAPQTGGAPLTVQFTDASTGATAWSWDFGDGTGSGSGWAVPGAGWAQPGSGWGTGGGGPNPTHAFALPGVYTVTLTATNGSGSASISHTVTVTAPTQDRPDVKIDLGTVPVPGVDAGWFELDSSLLDGEHLLAPGTIWHPLEGIVTDVAWDTGIGEARSRLEPGTMMITCVSKGRNLDPAVTDPPTSAAGPWGTYLADRPKIRLTIDDADPIIGTAEKVTAVYDRDVCITTFQVVDGVALLTKDHTWTPNVVERPGERITRLLRFAGFKGPTFIMPGTVDLQAGTEQSGPIVDQIADCVASEDGLAYFAGEAFVFLDRGVLAALQPTVGYSSTGQLFTIPYSRADYGFSTDTWWNEIRIKGVEDDSVEAVAANPDNVYRKGLRSLPLTLPIATYAERLALAKWLLSIYGERKARFRSLTFENAHGLVKPLRKAVLNTRPATCVAATHTPPGGEAITSTGVVIGQRGTYNRDGGLEVTVTLMPHRALKFFTLDSSFLDGSDVLV